MAKRTITYSEPVEYIPKELRKKFESGSTKKTTTKKTTKKKSK